MKIYRTKDSDHSIPLPVYKTRGSVGADLYYNDPTLPQKVLDPMRPRLFPTGIILRIPEGYEGQIRSRSSLARQGIIVANSPGTIDQDYEFEVGVILNNLNEDFEVINHGDRIAQLVISPVVQMGFEVLDELRQGGFGSTGKK